MKCQNIGLQKSAVVLMESDPSFADALALLLGQKTSLCDVGIVGHICSSLGGFFPRFDDRRNS